MARSAVAVRVPACSIAAAVIAVLAWGAPCSAGSLITVTDSQSWPAGTYHIDSLTISSTGNLTLEAGCVLVFDTDEGGVVVEGELHAEGELGSEVVFTSDDETSGTWNGIAAEPGGVLHLHSAEVRYAGYGTDVVTVDNATANLDHCVILPPTSIVN